MTSKKISEEILRHLGGQQFIQITGVKNFLIINLDNVCGLRMELPKNKSGANTLRIDIKKNGAYTMHFYNQKVNKKLETKINPIKRIDNVFCDKLRENFGTTTGLKTQP